MTAEALLMKTWGFWDNEEDRNYDSLPIDEEGEITVIHFRNCLYHASIFRKR